MSGPLTLIAHGRTYQFNTYKIFFEYLLESNPNQICGQGDFPLDKIITADIPRDQYEYRDRNHPNYTNILFAFAESPYFNGSLDAFAHIGMKNRDSWMNFDSLTDVNGLTLTRYITRAKEIYDCGKYRDSSLYAEYPPIFIKPEGREVQLNYVNTNNGKTKAISQMLIDMNNDIENVDSLSIPEEDKNGKIFKLKQRYYDVISRLIMNTDLPFDGNLVKDYIPFMNTDAIKKVLSHIKVAQPKQQNQNQNQSQWPDPTLEKTIRNLFKERNINSLANWNAKKQAIEKIITDAYKGKPSPTKDDRAKIVQILIGAAPAGSSKDAGSSKEQMANISAEEIKSPKKLKEPKIEFYATTPPKQTRFNTPGPGIAEPKSALKNNQQPNPTPKEPMTINQLLDLLKHRLIMDAEPVEIPKDKVVDNNSVREKRVQRST